VITNRYLEKIAAKLKDEGDAAKAFAQSSAAGYAGHVVGGAVGAIGAGLAASKSPAVGRLARKAIVGTRLLGRRFSSKGVGKKISDFAGKHIKGKGSLAAATAGGVAGGLAGEEAAQYAATRHNIMKAKGKEK
jgi:hypothetical protein